MVETAISIQALGIGVSAFIATLIAAFLLINAYHETLARSFAWGVVGLVIWAWFGFFSAIAADNYQMDVARQLRIFGVIGNVLFLILFTRFAFVYKRQHSPLTGSESLTLQLYIFTGIAFILLCILDLFGARTIVGDFFPNTVSPLGESMLDLFLIYYLLTIPILTIMMRRRFLYEEGSARRGGMILWMTMIASIILGSTGFLPYYGIVVPWLTALRGLAVPIFGVGAFYAMSSHNIFNFRVAAANAFVFGIWSALFLRILLHTDFKDAMTDFYLLIALVALGAFLIRSFNTELNARAEIERVERERAIEQSKSEFVSIAAHQLRTPLAGIRWTFNVLEGAEGLNHEQKELLKKGSERTKDVVERVNEMLRAARLTGDFKIVLSPQDIRPILRESVDMFQTAADVHNLKLESSIPRKVLMSRVDKEKFAIVIQNLIDNAIKYTRSGSVNVSARHIDESIEIRITDTGIGINEADSAHLFEKFYRQDDAVKMFPDGSGLGLFIVKKIVDAHGGTIRIESKKGEGTSFVIRVPVAKNG